MRRYLSTLHKKPDHHKKRFAFLASASFTLSVFAIWSFVNFGLPNQSISGISGPTVVQEDSDKKSIEPLMNGVAAAFKAIGGTFNEAKQGLEQVDFEGEYEEMRNKAFDTYGR